MKSGPHEVQSRRKSIGGRVAAGTSLVMFGSIVARLIGVGSIAVLGRVLSPADFGIYALSIIAVSLMGAVSNRQFALALIRIPQLEKAHYDTAFTLSIIWGAIASTLLLGFSLFLQIWYPSSPFGVTISVFAVLPLIESARSIRIVRFEKALNLVPETTIDVVSKLGQVAVSIALALIWRDHWALVAGLVTYGIGSALLTYFFAPYRPSLSLKGWREFFVFGGWLSGTGLAGIAINMFDSLMVGLMLGTKSAGIYNMGMELNRMTTDTLGAAVARAAYPGLASIRSDPPRLKAAYLKAQELLIAIMLPVGAGLAVTASEVIRVAVGGQWGGSVLILQCLAPVAAVSMTVYLTQAVLMAESQTKAMFFRNLIVVCVQIPLILVGTWFFGIVGTLAGRGCGMIVHTLLSLSLVKEYTGIGAIAVLTRTWRSTVACFTMVFVVLLLDLVVPEPLKFIDEVLILALKVITGFGIYCASHLALWALSGFPDGAESSAIVIAKSVRRSLRYVSGKTS